MINVIALIIMFKDDFIEKNIMKKYWIKKSL